MPGLGSSNNTGPQKERSKTGSDREMRGGRRQCGRSGLWILAGGPEPRSRLGRPRPQCSVLGSELQALGCGFGGPHPRPRFWAVCSDIWIPRSSFRAPGSECFALSSGFGGKAQCSVFGLWLLSSGVQTLWVSKFWTPGSGPGSGFGPGG